MTFRFLLLLQKTTFWYDHTPTHLLRAKVEGYRVRELNERNKWNALFSHHSQFRGTNDGFMAHDSVDCFQLRRGADFGRGENSCKEPAGDQ